MHARALVAGAYVCVYAVRGCVCACISMYVCGVYTCPDEPTVGVDPLLRSKYDKHQQHILTAEQSRTDSIRTELNRAARQHSNAPHTNDKDSPSDRSDGLAQERESRERDRATAIATRASCQSETRADGSALCMLLVLLRC